ncbi:MAG: 3-hydroxyacyl-CoA dehydrogenase [Deltaproteobacteria bacterium]|nr:3-hydroxyacyl-CoA dehydrogenase [Deltaproteobacteria bacterium]
MKLDAAVALVTGGASGLGEATVRAFMAKGAHVAIMDRPNSNGEQLAKELGADKALFVSADVTNTEQVTAAIQATMAKFGAIHINVNCAGVGTAMKTTGKAGPMPLEMFELCIRVNLIGTFNVLRLAATEMLKNKPSDDGERGVIINTASVAAFDGQIGQAAYSASKGGVVGMTLPIARDLSRDGIRCLTIAPGTFDTPMLAMLPEPQRQALAANIPFPSRLGKPPEYAALAVHMVENAYLNGETVRLDGSIRMPPK